MLKDQKISEFESSIFDNKKDVQDDQEDSEEEKVSDQVPVRRRRPSADLNKIDNEVQDENAAAQVQASPNSNHNVVARNRNV